MINPTLISGRRTALIGDESSRMKLGIHPDRIEKNEHRPYGFDHERRRM